MVRSVLSRLLTELTSRTEEYKEFYKAFFKDSEEPMAWDHFSGEAGSGVNFKAIVYLPSKMYMHPSSLSSCSY